jgi:hypothetical protein
VPLPRTIRKPYRTSPDDIDRSDGAPQLLFDRASKDLELIVAREDKGRHDEHSFSFNKNLSRETTTKGGNKKKESGRGEERGGRGGSGGAARAQDGGVSNRRVNKIGFPGQKPLRSKGCRHCQGHIEP